MLLSAGHEIKTSSITKEFGLQTFCH